MKNNVNLIWVAIVFLAIGLVAGFLIASGTSKTGDAVRGVSYNQEISGDSDLIDTGDDFTNYIISTAKNNDPSVVYELLSIAKKNNLINTFEDTTVFNSNKESVKLITPNLIIYRDPRFKWALGFCYCLCGGANQTCGWTDAGDCEGTCNSCTTTGCSEINWSS
jgi:hypothetical protein